MLTQLTYTRIDYKQKTKNVWTWALTSFIIFQQKMEPSSRMWDPACTGRSFAKPMSCVPTYKTSHRDPAKKERRSVRGQFDRFGRYTRLCWTNAKGNWNLVEIKNSKEKKKKKKKYMQPKFEKNYTCRWYVGEFVIEECRLESSP